MANPLSKMKVQAGKVAVSAVDYAVANRFHDAEALIDRARFANPNATRTQLADAVIARVSKEMATMGAMSGAVAAAPGVGTTASVATTAADIGLAFGRISTMVMAIGLAYGHDLSNVDQRKQWVYSVLSGAPSELTQSERKAGDLKKQLGEQALGTKTPGTGISKMNEVVATRVGTKIAGRMVSERVALKLATLIPLGVGAGVGAVGNRALVRSVGRHAKKFFDTWPKDHVIALPPAR